MRATNDISSFQRNVGHIATYQGLAIHAIGTPLASPCASVIWFCVVSTVVLYCIYLEQNGDDFPDGHPCLHLILLICSEIVTLLQVDSLPCIAFGISSIPSFQCPLRGMYFLLQNGMVFRIGATRFRVFSSFLHLESSKYWTMFVLIHGCFGNWDAKKPLSCSILRLHALLSNHVCQTNCRKYQGGQRVNVELLVILSGTQ